MKLATEKRGVLIPLAQECVLGAVIWFGTQILSQRDNFSDQINPWYFGGFYVAAFSLGLFARSTTTPAGVTLTLSQVVCYLIYPNVSWELGNLFPIAAAFLFVCTAPAAVVAFLGSNIRRIFFRRNRAV